MTPKHYPQIFKPQKVFIFLKTKKEMQKFDPPFPGSHMWLMAEKINLNKRKSKNIFCQQEFIITSHKIQLRVIKVYFLILIKEYK